MVRVYCTAQGAKSVEKTKVNERFARLAANASTLCNQGYVLYLDTTRLVTTSALVRRGVSQECLYSGAQCGGCLCY
jgi:hypothetical protein